MNVASKMPLYAILGASGKIGFATSSALRRAGMSVRAVLHDTSKAVRLELIGCEVAVADVRNVDSLREALDKADVVQIVLPLNPAVEDPISDMQKGIECITEVLETVRPKSLLLISDYGAHVHGDIGIPSIFRAFEERLRRLEAHKIFLRSAEHMENWAPALAVARESGVLPTFHIPIDATFPTVSAHDVGLEAANLLKQPIDGNDTEVVHIEGPYRYSAKDVADTLSYLLGQTVVAQAAPRAKWDESLRLNTSPSLAELLIKTNDAQNKGGLVEVEPGCTAVKYGATTLREALQALIGS